VIDYLLTKMRLMRERNVIDAMADLRADLPSSGPGYVRDRRWVEFIGQCRGRKPVS